MSSSDSANVSDDDILHSLWGVIAGEGHGSLWSILSDGYRLDAYFSYCQKQFKRVKHPISPRQVLFLVEYLGSSKSIARREIKLALIAKQNSTSRTEVKDLSSSSTDRDEYEGVSHYLGYLEGQDGIKWLDYGLDVAASIILAVHVTHDPDSIEPGRSKIQWKDLESLEDFIEKAFPKVITDSDVTPIKPSKLRAMYFEAHAGIQIQWTEHLYDHLQLSTSENSKVLRVFQLPCLLEAALEVLKHPEPNSPAQRAQIPPEERRNDERNEKKREENSSVDGSSPPQVKSNGVDISAATAGHVRDEEISSSINVQYSREFLFETLMTLQLLFPAQDRKKLKGKAIREPAWLPSWLRFILNRQKLDSHLSSTFVPEGQYQRPLTNRRELYERYPYWGLRLHMLLEEVEDPTPLSWVGRWSERRKAARYSFWVTFAAFVIAIVFGLVATALGAVQVWISYCQWQGDGGGSVCQLRGSTAMNNGTSP